MDPLSLTHSTVVAVPPGAALDLFTSRLGEWWPAEYTWSQDALEHIEIEPLVGGRAFERGPAGFECDWGRVLAIEPSALLAFSWQIAPDRTPQPDAGKASEVSVRFAAEGERATRIELEHTHFERHGEGGAGYRDALASPQGWPFMLSRLAALR